MAPNVIRVLPMNDYTIQVHFSDGKVVCYDVKPLLSQGVFKQLQNIHIFKSISTTTNETVVLHHYKWNVGVLVVLQYPIWVIFQFLSSTQIKWMKIQRKEKERIKI